MRNLKKQLQELEELLDLTHGQLNTEVRAVMKFKIGQLKKQADEADAIDQWRIASEAAQLLASLLSIVTNVMTLLK
ncbi:MAG: hypothetical protein KXJ60_05315 [Hydrogenophaga sp.]|jgi:hypothetical protein|uniref:hypothetical protein n=1 Tax=Hydrogenophaga sp. TaxID=1904254 RepID=UPI0025B9223F|nr:hypothetical protein [Hydrogenophaga sp.]MBW0183266.1 hypothetical protein [Hydrogenophaga sp.]